jgi:hypothetical protein
MEKGCYQTIIEEVSDKISAKILTEENNLAEKARFIDMDISEIVREIGLQVTEKVLKNTRDNMVEKKGRWTCNTSQFHY